MLHIYMLHMHMHNNMHMYSRVLQPQSSFSRTVCCVCTRYSRALCVCRRVCAFSYASLRPVFVIEIVLLHHTLHASSLSVEPPHRSERTEKLLDR